MDLLALLALLREPINLIVLGVSIALTSGVLVAVSYFVKSKKFEMLEKYGRLLIASIQQTAENMPGYRKKELAMIALRELNAKLGTKATEEELEMILEANVYLLKKVAALTPGTGDDEFVEAVTGGIVE